MRQMPFWVAQCGGIMFGLVTHARAGDKSYGVAMGVRGAAQERSVWSRALPWNGLGFNVPAPTTRIGSNVL